MDMTIIWLLILVALLIAEFITLGLTTIWFAGGALAAIIATELGASMIVQIIVFLAVSVVILFLFRPKAVSYFNNKREKTNADGLIGKEAKIIETVNNKENSGKAIINGQEWTARGKDDKDVFEVDSWVKVDAISGVKLILTNNKEEQ